MTRSNQREILSRASSLLYTVYVTILYRPLPSSGVSVWHHGAPPRLAHHGRDARDDGRTHRSRRFGGGGRVLRTGAGGARAARSGARRSRRVGGARGRGAVGRRRGTDSPLGAATRRTDRGLGSFPCRVDGRRIECGPLLA